VYDRTPIVTRAAFQRDPRPVASARLKTTDADEVQVARKAVFHRNADADRVDGAADSGGTLA